MFIKRAKVDMTRYGFKLYITRQSIHSETAEANLRRICEKLADGECNVTVLDVAEDPDQAEIDHILATPTLIKEYPLPQRRVIGDLSDMEKVTKALGLDS